MWIKTNMGEFFVDIKDRGIYGPYNIDMALTVLFYLENLGEQALILDHNGELVNYNCQK